MSFIAPADTPRNTNSTSQIGGNDNLTPGISRIFVATAGSIFLVIVIFLIVCTFWPRLRHRHNPLHRTDLEARAAKRPAEEPIDLHTLDDANPSRKYSEVKGLRKQATWASSQSTSAEVCAICLEILLDTDDVRRLKCKHVFHKSCLDSWFQKHHNDCPLCKSIFIPNKKADSSSSPEVVVS